MTYGDRIIKIAIYWMKEGKEKNNTKVTGEHSFNSSKYRLQKKN